MKKVIILESLKLSQSKIIKKNLKFQHLLLLDYLNQFFTTCKTLDVVEYKKDIYYSITYNKIIDDLPILGIKKRRLQELFSDLEAAKIIKRLKSPIHTPRICIKLCLSGVEV